MLLTKKIVSGSTLIAVMLASSVLFAAGPKEIPVVDVNVVNEAAVRVVGDPVEVRVVGARLGTPYFLQGNQTNGPVHLAPDIQDGKAFILKRVFAKTQTYNPLYPGDQELQSAYIEFLDSDGQRFALIPMPQNIQSIIDTTYNYIGDMDIPWRFEPGESIRFLSGPIGIASYGLNLSIIGEIIDLPPDAAQ